jgi:photosystem II stability/assembly factor-like uncharacterized protein
MFAFRMPNWNSGFSVRIAVTGFFLFSGLAIFGQAPRDRRAHDWFQSLRAYPFGSIPASARLKAIDKLSNMRPAERGHAELRGQVVTESPLRWTMIGPQPVGLELGAQWGVSAGRVTALAVDPRNANVVYAGAAEGGVWKTVDGGQNWTPLTDDQPALSVGSLALDPSNPDVLYVGTGEANFNGDAYAGSGVLKTTDGGQTWKSIPGRFVGKSIAALAVNLADSRILLAASSGGIFRSTDAGNTWKSVLPATFGSSVLFDPMNPQNAYAGLGYVYGGFPAGVYKSTDAGVTWSALNGTDPNNLPTSKIGRVALAISPTNSAVLIAGIQNSSNIEQTVSVYRTMDGGLNWNSIDGKGYFGNWYSDVIQFHPNDPNVVLGAGVSLSASFDGGVTWQAVGDPLAVHSDIHAIAFSQDGTQVYLGSDGGVWTATDLSSQGATWQSLNATLAITQFYPGISTHPVDPNVTFGGTQDNGILRSYGELTWGYVVCGDGSATAIDPATPSTVYVVCTGTNVGKSTLGGLPRTFRSASAGLDPSDGQFIAPLAIAPSNPMDLYYGGASHVYQTTDGANHWAAISSDLTNDGSGICAITVAPSDSNTVYAGTCEGGFWVTTTAGAGTGTTWVDHSAGLPDRAITSIAVHPGDPNTAYVTFSGFLTDHVFKTTDGGQSWMGVSGDLLDISANALVIDPDLPGTLYLATDIGVFWTTDDGDTWSPLSQGLPQVAVLDLKLHRPSRTLRAATHGRSMWDLQLPLTGSTMAGSAVQGPQGAERR